MPTYGYECKECKNTFEIIQSIKDEPLTVCSKCGGKLRKTLYPVGIVFKGAGFHINDYKSDNSAASSAYEKERSPKPETPAAKTPSEPVPSTSPSK